MKIKQYKLVLSVSVICSVAILGIGLLIPKTETALAGQSKQPRDVFGTQIGTTTAPTTSGSFFGDYAANSTTSSVLLLDGTTDIVLLTMKALTASSSAFYEWNVFGSNDTNCDTATTSTIFNVATVSQINWYDVDPTNSRTSGRSTNPGNATGTSVLFNNLNWRCLKVLANGSSTTVLMQIKEKINN
jgi:hypothetical protein